MFEEKDKMIELDFLWEIVNVKLEWPFSNAS